MHLSSYQKLALFLSFYWLIITSWKLINITDIPPFIDEVWYTFLGAKLNTDPGNLLLSIDYSIMPFISWFLAFTAIPLQSLINPVTAGRIMIILIETISAIVVFFIGKNLFNTKTGVISTVIYSLLPLTFFHSRLLLLDPINNLFTLFSLLIVIRFYQTKLTILVFVTSITILMFLNMLTKPTSVLSLLIIFIISSAIFFSHRVNQLKTFKPTLIILISLTLIFLSNLFLVLYFQNNFNLYLAEPAPVLNLITKLKYELLRSNLWLGIYVTPPVLIVLLIATIYAVIKKHVILISLILSIVLVIFFTIILGKNFYPRHLYLVSGLIALSVGFILSKMKNSLLLYLTILLIILPSLILDFNIIYQPLKAQIALEDQKQYLSDWSAGYTVQKSMTLLNEISTQKLILTINQPVIVWGLENRIYGNIVSPNTIIRNLNAADDQAIQSFSKQYPNFDIYFLDFGNILISNPRLQLIQYTSNLHIYEFTPAAY